MRRKAATPMSTEQANSRKATTTARLLALRPRPSAITPEPDRQQHGRGEAAPDALAELLVDEPLASPRDLASGRHTTSLPRFLEPVLGLLSVLFGPQVWQVGPQPPPDARRDVRRGTRTGGRHAQTCRGTVGAPCSARSSTRPRAVPRLGPRLHRQGDGAPLRGVGAGRASSTARCSARPARPGFLGMAVPEEYGGGGVDGLPLQRRHRRGDPAGAA